MIGKRKEIKMLKQIILTTAAVSLLTTGSYAKAIGAKADVSTVGIVTDKDLKNYTGEKEPPKSCTFNDRRKQEGKLTFNPVEKSDDHPRDEDWNSAWNSTFTSETPVGIQVSYYGVTKLLIHPVLKGGKEIVTKHTIKGHSPVEETGIVSSVTYNEVKFGDRVAETQVAQNMNGVSVTLPDPAKNKHGYTMPTTDLTITFKPTLNMAPKWDAKAGEYIQHFTITCLE